MASTRRTSKAARFWVLAFFALLAGYAVFLLALGIAIRNQPPGQWDQLRFSQMLTFAYQKYRKDYNAWPDTAMEAGHNYNSEYEAGVFSDLVKKAEKDWGMSAVVEQREKGPTLVIHFEKPLDRTRTYLLSEKPR